MSNCGDGERPWLFHPYEIGFAGFSNTGKTRCITRLIERMHTVYQIGYVKHASCGFSLDRHGKDSDFAYRSGAATVHLIDEDHHATIQRGKGSLFFHRFPLLENDFLFIEGYKQAFHEKIVFLDPEKEILKQTNHVVATVGEGGNFHLDDLAEIEAFILQHLRNKAQARPLHGLVLAGGHSRRMGRDKALIAYLERPQARICYELLSELCDRVFVSRRSDQEPIDLPILYDEVQEIGPLGGILTAMKMDPHAAWLVLACDYPWMDLNTLTALVERRNPFRFATAFEGTDGLPEPLCAIYEPKIYPFLLQSLAFEEFCPRKALMHLPIALSAPPSHQALRNVNEPLNLSREEITSPAHTK